LTTNPLQLRDRHLVYLEAYPKSLASTLHGDSIDDIIGQRRPSSKAPKTDRQSAPDKYEKVRFRIFAGVAPRRYAALFESRRELKDKDGSLKRRPSDEAPEHNDQVFTRSFIEFEKRIAETVDQLAKARAEERR
jgi:hypothetical protein